MGVNLRDIVSRREISMKELAGKKLDMNKQIRTGVIGVGNMGQHHARIYASTTSNSKE